MTTRSTSDAIDTMPEEAFLLPWYVNGTLSPEETRQVEAALARSAELRDELALLRAVSDAVRETTDAMPAPDPEGLARMMARIDAEPARRARPARVEERRPSWSERIAGAFGGVLRPAMAAAAVVIAVQAAAIVVLVDRQPAGQGAFVTASGPSATGPGASAPAESGPRLLVTFQDTATAADIRAALDAIEGSIVRGPTADGSFVIRLRGDAEAAVAALRARSGVVVTADKML